jgi:hypothetical protein
MATMSTAAAAVTDLNIQAWPPDLPKPVLRASSAVHMTRSGRFPNLEVKSGFAWVPLHAVDDPVGEADQWLAAARTLETSTLFVVGLGLGYVVDALERRGWTGRVIALEPNAATLPAFLARRDWRAWLRDGRLAILTGPDYHGLSRLVPSIEPEFADPVVVTNPTIARLVPTGVAAAQQLAQKAWFGASANVAARTQSRARYLINTLRNAMRIAREADVTALDGRLPGVPAIVVDAGPSLDRNLADLPAAKGRALIIAVDTAARPLLTAGITPDLIVAVDPTEVNARHLCDLPGANATFLAAEGSLDPAAASAFEGRTFFGRLGGQHPWPWLASLGLSRGPMQAWGSALTAALDLAIRMGCDPIVFAGADLAFTAGRSHARHTTFEEDGHRQVAWGETLEDFRARSLASRTSVELAGVDGAHVRTSPHQVAFRDWLLEEARRHPDRRFVDGTAAGIRAGGPIEQAGLSTTLASLARLATNVRGAVAEAHARRTDVTKALADGVASLKASGIDAGRSPLAEWIAFAGGEHVVSEIARALDPVPPAPHHTRPAVTAESTGGSEATAPVVATAERQALGDLLRHGL